MSQSLNNSGTSSPLLFANVDNTGRIEVAENVATGEYVLDNDNLPLFFDSEDVGTGSQVYDPVTNTQVLNVTANNDVSIFQTIQWHPYFPGHAQQAEFTFINLEPETNVIKRIGYYHTDISSPFDANIDGLYLESSSGEVTLNIAKEGSVTSISQSNWLDPLDGSGASGIDINWNNFQVFILDFLYLGGTYVNLYTLYQNRRHLIHRYDFVGTVADTMMGTPAQPLRAEIRSIGGSGEFRFSCGQVSTQGASIEFSGIPIGVDSGNSLITAATSGTEYVIKGIRKNTRNVEFFLKGVSVASAAGANEAYLWKLIINPTLSAGLTYSALPNSGLDIATGDGVITVTPGTGYIVGSGVGNSRSSNSLEITKELRIGHSIAGVYDELILSVIPYSNGQDIASTLNGVVI